MLIFSIVDKPEQCGVGVVILLLGIPVYYIWVDKTREIEASEWWVRFTEKCLVFMNCALEEHLMADHSRLLGDEDEDEKLDIEPEIESKTSIRGTPDLIDSVVARQLLSPYSVVGVAMCSPI